MAGFVNKGFSFATSNQKTKSHVVESQITLLVGPCLSLAEKQSTMNHMIIFSDSISKFYQCRIRGFCRDISMFFSICLRNIFLLEKENNKSNVSLNKKVIFVFHTIFKLDFITNIIYSFIHRCMYSVFILFLFSYISF